MTVASSDDQHHATGDVLSRPGEAGAVDSQRTSGDRLRSMGFLTALALLLSSLACYALPEKIISVDFICYFSAARILVSGQSPYDIASQTEVQHALGWDRATSGFGVYDCLPYFYPPWFALACVPLLALGYPAAKVVFFFFNIELALVSGHLLQSTVRGVARWLPVVFISFFIFTLVTALLGQTALLMLFLIVLAWKLLDGGHDRIAGVVLAWLTIKPQLTAILLLGVLLWAIRQRRWSVIGAFLLTVAFFVGICTAILPSWPLQMLKAPGQTPPPTEASPWIGNTWFLLLRSAGAQGWGLWLAYLGLAVPFLITVVRTALDRTRHFADVLGLGTIAAFFVAPYARHYDFPVLIVPTLILAVGRLPRAAATVFLLTLVLLPYVQYFVLAQYKAVTDPDGKFLVECTFFWVPVLLAGAWLFSGRKGRRELSGQFNLPTTP
jgi:hypothetical protein